MIQELQDRFDEQHVLPPVLALESVIVEAANGEIFQSFLVKTSCSQDDFNFDVLNRHLTILVDFIKEGFSTMRKVWCDEF